MKVENAVKVEPVGEFELKGIRRPLVAYNVIGQFQPENEPAVDRAMGGSPIRLVHEGFETRDLREATALLEELAIGNRPVTFGRI
jgi:hypothetical protein